MLVNSPDWQRLHGSYATEASSELLDAAVPQREVRAPRGPGRTMIPAAYCGLDRSSELHREQLSRLCPVPGNQAVPANRSASKEARASRSMT